MGPVSFLVGVAFCLAYVATATPVTLGSLRHGDSSLFTFTVDGFSSLTLETVSGGTLRNAYCNVTLSLPVVINSPFNLCFWASHVDPARYNRLEQITTDEGPTLEIQVTQPIVFYSDISLELSVGDVISVAENITDTFDVRTYRYVVVTAPTKGEVTSTTEGVFPLVYTATSEGEDTFSVRVFPLGFPELYTNETTFTVTVSAPPALSIVVEDEELSAYLESTAVGVHATITNTHDQFAIVSISQDPVIGFLFVPEWTPTEFEGNTEFTFITCGETPEFPTCLAIEVQGSQAWVNAFLANLSFVGTSTGLTTVTFSVSLLDDSESTSATTQINVIDPSIGNTDGVIFITSWWGTLAVVLGVVAFVLALLWVFSLLYKENKTRTE